MKWIGITGGIASGKSTVCAILERKGFSIVDADQISHELTRPGQPAYQEIIRTFGQEILLENPNGKNSPGRAADIDRKKLGKLIFEDVKEREKLESILHPQIRQQVLEKKKILEASGVKLAFYDVPLLFEKNMQKDFDTTVLILVSRKIQLERLKTNRKLTSEEAQARIQSQMPMSEKEKLADFVIDNNGSLVELEKNIDQVMQNLSR